MSIHTNVWPTVRGGLLLAATLGGMACGSSPEEAVDPPTVQRPAELDARQLKSQRGTTSHEAGKNCMACHGPNGQGPGRFTVAGTAFTAARQPNPDATVTLSTKVNGGGTVVLTLEADASGNFYTTDPVPLPDTSLFPRVTSRATASFHFMPFPTSSAACNVCHVGRQTLSLD
jgi:hypothetical protein